MVALQAHCTHSQEFIGLSMTPANMRLIILFIYLLSLVFPSSVSVKWCFILIYMYAAFIACEADCHFRVCHVSSFV